MVPEMERVFERMQLQSPRIAPTEGSYLALLEAYARHGLQDKARRTLASMRRLRYKLGPQAFHWALQAHATVRRTDSWHVCFASNGQIQGFAAC